MAMGAPGRRGGLEHPAPVPLRNPRSAWLHLECVVGAPHGARLPQNAKPGNAGRGAGLHAGLPAGRAESLRGNSRLAAAPRRDRKSTRLNSSHSQISYAVFCLKKKNASEQTSYSWTWTEI